MKWSLILLCTFAAIAAADEVYKVVGDDGSVRYTDRAPDRRSRPMDLGAPSGTTPAATSSGFQSLAALQAAARFAVSVESPTPGQVLGADQTEVVAAASVMPGLVSGFRLLYLLDGRATSDEPVDTLSVLLDGLAPGRHQLSVVLVDAQGRERARSEPVAFTVVSAGAPK